MTNPYGYVRGLCWECAPLRNMGQRLGAPYISNQPAICIECGSACARPLKDYEDVPTAPIKRPQKGTLSSKTTAISGDKQPHSPLKVGPFGPIFNELGKKGT